MQAAAAIAPPSRESIQIAEALRHPIRAQILMRMNAPIRRLSPSEFAEEQGLAVGDASYHFRKLEKFGCLTVVEEHKRRGATEHVYEPVKRAMAWTSEWEMMGAVVKQHLAASVLRGGVERIGGSIDSGKFDARDSILAWDTAWVDEEGWNQIHAIFKGALEETLMVIAEATKRVEDAPSEEKFLATYLLSTFESDPERPTLAE